MWKRQLLQTVEKQNYKNSRICFHQIKTVWHHQCLQIRNHCSRRWFLHFPKDFFLLIFIKFDSYNCIPIACFSLWSVAVWFIYFLYISLWYYLSYVYRKIISTFPVLISSNNSLGEFSPVEITFCVFSLKKFFLIFLNLQKRHAIN